jgi:hypothetical protein
MKKSLIILFISSLALVSCVEPEAPKASGDSSKKDNARVAEAVDSSGVAAKNFAQVNNTYASLTGISMGAPLIVSEYQAIKTQLPSTSNPKSLNGFNQIASTRLAFAYCDEYVDGRADLRAMGNDAAINNLLDSFIDIDRGNSDHQVLISELGAIMRDDDSLISDGNATSKKTKLIKLSCTAILSSSYVTLI